MEPTQSAKGMPETPYQIFSRKTGRTWDHLLSLGMKWLFIFSEGPQPFTFWAVSSEGKIVDADYDKSTWEKIIVHDPARDFAQSNTLSFSFDEDSPSLRLKATLEAAYTPLKT